MLCLVAQSCPTLCYPMDCSPPDSSSMGILQARMLQRVAMSSSRESSQPRDETQVSHIAEGVFTISATREAPEYCSGQPTPSPGYLTNPGNQPGSPALQADSLLAKLPQVLSRSFVQEVVKHTLPMHKMQETWVRSLGQTDSPRGGNGNPLQYSYLGNPMDREAWQATVHEVTKSQTRLSN